MSNTMMVTKAQKEILMDLILRTTLGETVSITNAVQHSLAESLIKQGLIVVVAKKNYGRIAKVRAA